MTFADWVMLATGLCGAVLFTLGLVDAARRLSYIKKWRRR